jgi:peptidoglycan/xylan/chitin deacetylase (PgdA/CDA1 family)
LNIPIFIFVNEGRPKRDSSPIATNKLLEKWLKRKYINVGNHTKNHLRYSTTQLDTFKQDIINGEKITRKLIKKNNKKLKYFRFPFNDLGSDSNSQQKISDFLISMNYSIAPFTIESSDWMYNSVYEYFLKGKDSINAKKIGQDYVEKTIEFIDFFEKVSLKYFNRNINQIYLCHDNMINTDYLPEIVEKLKIKNYNFIGLEEALHDEVYKNKNYYSKKWGISWIYRWIENGEERKRIMQTEPTTLEIEKLFNTIQEKN